MTQTAVTMPVLSDTMQTGRIARWLKQPGDPEGHIGFQVHGIKQGSGPYSVRWRAVKFKTL